LDLPFSGALNINGGAFWGLKSPKNGLFAITQRPGKAFFSKNPVFEALFRGQIDAIKNPFWDFFDKTPSFKRSVCSLWA
jgi:hypothetical protein